MENYAKKLKDALENGVPDTDVVKIHEEILSTAEMSQNIRKAKIKDTDLYNAEIENYVRSGNSNTQQVIRSIEFDVIEKSNEGELAIYNLELNEFLGENITPEVKLKLDISSSPEVIRKFENDLKKKDLIELNTLQIKLLKEESIQLQLKIVKNNELIEYLTEEMNRQ